MNLKTGLLAGACVILAVVAVIGWTHGRSADAVNQPATYAQPGAQPAYGQPVNSPPPDYNANPAYATAAPAYPAENSPVYGNGVAYQSGAYYPDEQYVQIIPRPVVVRRAEEPPPPPPAYVDEARPREYREYREKHHGRSTGKSVAIVAGSAGVGAAVGALAGGGKGAGIGALVGGGGGFVYDRLTHNR
jgi:hypothetical protein